MLEIGTFVILNMVHIASTSYIKYRKHIIQVAVRKESHRFIRGLFLLYLSQFFFQESVRVIWFGKS